MLSLYICMCVYIYLYIYNTFAMGHKNRRIAMLYAFNEPTNELETLCRLYIYFISNRP